MTRKEAIKKIREAMPTLWKETIDAIQTIIPELTESEDERIRKTLIHIVKGACDKYGIKYRGEEIGEEKLLAYLEKQKAKERLDRMAPIYNDKESFESALEKAWKYYNESASRKVDSFEDDYIECVFSKGFREGFLYREKQKEQEHNEGDFTIYHPLKNGKGKYECIPYSFYGSLTSFSEDKDLIDFLRTCFYTEEECNEWIEQQKEQKQQLPLMGGDTDTYFDDLRMTTKPLTSREWFNEGIKYAQRLQKEQKPVIKLVFPRFRVGDIIRNVHDEWDKTTKRISYVGEHGYNFDYRHLRGNAGGGSFGFCYEDYYELVEQKHAEWSDTDNIGWDEAFACVTRAEKAAKNEEELQNAVIAEKWLKEIKFKYYVHPVKQEWSKEDENKRTDAINFLKCSESHYVKPENISKIVATIDWLKSLHPQPRQDRDISTGDRPRSNFQGAH